MAVWSNATNSYVYTPPSSSSLYPEVGHVDVMCVCGRVTRVQIGLPEQISIPQPSTPREKHMASKTLHKLLMDELRTTDADKVDAVADVVFEWLKQVEDNGHLSLASYWRDAVEENRKQEVSTGIGR